MSSLAQDLESIFLTLCCKRRGRWPTSYCENCEQRQTGNGYNAECYWQCKRLSNQFSKLVKDIIRSGTVKECLETENKPDSGSTDWKLLAIITIVVFGSLVLALLVVLIRKMRSVEDTQLQRTSTREEGSGEQQETGPPVAAVEAITNRTSEGPDEDYYSTIPPLPKSAINLDAAVPGPDNMIASNSSMPTVSNLIDEPELSQNVDEDAVMTVNVCYDKTANPELTIM